MAHEVLSDAVMCFQLLRGNGGVMAFDDYANRDNPGVMAGIDTFLSAFEHLVTVVYAGFTLIVVKN